jgi:Putative Flp pilus-assembly TadE/G-like
VSALLGRMRCGSGQAFVLVVVALMGFVGLASLVIDGSSWFRTQRQMQTAVDAAALAGAQDISKNISNQTGARATAVDYGSRNKIVIDPAHVTFPASGAEIDVEAWKPVSGLFIRALNATAHAHARAKVSVPLNMKYIAPIAVKTTAACFISNPACFGQTVTVDLNESQIGNLDGWINLACHDPSLGPCETEKTDGGELKLWIDEGYQDALPVNQWYGIKTGGTNGVKNTLENHTGEPLLIPVWDQVSLSPLSYHIIGWAAFVIDPNGVDFTGQSKKLTGHFVTFNTHDVPAGNPIGGADDFGVHVITLTQ